MSARKKKSKSSVIQAAGGLVWRQVEESLEIALIHRQRYDDWSLPKGKLHKGETWEQAATREVEEEINCQVRLEDFAGCTCYQYEGRPKVVLFWHMFILKEDHFVVDYEVDRLVWLAPEKALELLSYEGEKSLVRAALEISGN